MNNRSNLFLMWLCAALFYGFQFIIRVSPGVMVNNMMSSLGLEACIMGALTSLYYYGYSTLQVPAGLILDNVGQRRPIAIALLLCSLGCFVFAFSTTVVSLSFGRFLMGVGSAFAFLSSLKLASIHFSPQRMALFVGLTMLIGTTGATSAGYPLGILIKYTSWQTAMYILGGMSLALAMLAYLTIQDRNERVKGISFSESAARMFKTFLNIIKNPQTWIYGLYGFLMYVPLSGFADLWGAPYIQNVFKVEDHIAAGAVTVFYVGIGAGSPLWSYILTYFESYKKCMGIGAFGTILLYVVIIYGAPFFHTALPGTGLTLVTVLFFVAGLFSASQFMAFAAVTDLNPRENSGTATGTHNMLCMLSGIIMQPVIGILMDLSWSGGFDEKGGRLYESVDYFFGLMLIPACLFLAVMNVFLMKEPYRKHG